MLGDWQYRLRLRDQMQYCTDHPEEVSKLSKVKAQVEQVKSITMENIDKVITNVYQYMLSQTCMT